MLYLTCLQPRRHVIRIYHYIIQSVVLSLYVFAIVGLVLCLFIGLLTGSESLLSGDDLLLDKISGLL